MIGEAVGSIAFLAVGRPTFDLPSAQPLCCSALKAVRAVVPTTIGNSRLHLSAKEIAIESAGWPQSIRTVIIAFGTFSDATLAGAAIDDLGSEVNVVLWSFPEERTGGRLLRNSLCGANLAAFHLRAQGRNVRGIHAEPANPEVEQMISAALEAKPTPTRPSRSNGWSHSDTAAALKVAQRLESAHIGIVGDAPVGFDPCLVGADPKAIGATFQFERLDQLLAAADAVGTPVVLPTGAQALHGIDQLDQAATTRSLQLHSALTTLAERHDWDAFALRCWPECFGWGGAACAPLSLLTEEGIPGACEADGFGALTSLMLTTVSDRPAFLADLVDLDPADNTVVFWHCGVAPTSMADPARPVLAAAHPNRGTPLAVQFGLRPGRVTIARLSRSKNQLRLVLGTGSVVAGPPPFSGTSAVVRMDTPAAQIHSDLMTEGLEHHFGLAYGDHATVLRALADHWGITVLELGGNEPS